MPVSGANLTASVSASGSSYVTASCSFGAERLAIVAVRNARASNPTQPTLSGGDRTWTAMLSVLFSSNQHRLTVFYSYSEAPSSGALTISFGGVSQVNCGWVVDEYSAVTPASPPPLLQISPPVSSTSPGGASLLLGFGAYGSTLNGAAAYFAGSSVGLSALPGVDGWTETAESTSGSTGAIQGQWSATTQTFAGVTWSGSTADAGIAFELDARDNLPVIAVEAVPGTNLPPLLLAQAHADEVSAVAFYDLVDAEVVPSPLDVEVIDG